MTTKNEERAARYVSVSAIIASGEPFFVIRAQDAVSGDAVRAWADLAEAQGASPDILQSARSLATEMDAWPNKKIPDALKVE